MNFRLEPSTLIAPTVTIMALVLALTTFLILRMVGRYQSIQDRWKSEDIPDNLRRSKWFWALSHVEVVPYFGLMIYAIVVAVWSINLVTRIISYYMEFTGYHDVEDVAWQLEDFFARQDLAAEFGDLTLERLFTLFALLIVIALVELLPSMPLQPVSLGWFYWRASRGSKVGIGNTDRMLQQARTSLGRDEYLSAVLLGGTALEFFLRGILGIRVGASWQEITSRLSEKLKAIELPKADQKDILERLASVRRQRNMAAHPTPDTSFTGAEVEDFLQNVQLVMMQLR